VTRPLPPRALDPSPNPPRRCRQISFWFAVPAILTIASAAQAIEIPISGTYGTIAICIMDAFTGRALGRRQLQCWGRSAGARHRERIRYPCGILCISAGGKPIRRRPDANLDYRGRLLRQGRQCNACVEGNERQRRSHRFGKRQDWYGARHCRSMQCPLCGLPTNCSACPPHRRNRRG
jgi:hypothetical protein